MRKHTSLIIAIIILGLATVGCQDGPDVAAPPQVVADHAELPFRFELDDKASCCVGIRGNVDNDPNENIDISDLVYLVDWIYHGGPAPACVPEADMNADNAVTSFDVDYLVNYMFKGGPAPVSCN